MSERRAGVLGDTLIRASRQPGLHCIQPRGAHGAAVIESWRVRLAAGASETFFRPDEETVIVLQEGRATWSASGDTWTVSRQNVFDERATALCLPPGVTFTCAALSNVECVLMTAAAPPGGSVGFVDPDHVQVHARGRDSYARSVHDLFVADPCARRLMVGETFTPPGHWSSFPPHKHDGRDGEPRLEEVYHYRVRPSQGFGHQMLYTNDGEAVTHVVRDGDVVVLPYGYHPVSSPPGYHLYYLWALAGDERRLALFEDPDHRWIHDAH